MIGSTSQMSCIATSRSYHIISYHIISFHKMKLEKFQKFTTEIESEYWISAHDMIVDEQHVKYNLCLQYIWSGSWAPPRPPAWVLEGGAGGARLKRTDPSYYFTGHDLTINRHMCTTWCTCVLVPEFDVHIKAHHTASQGVIRPQMIACDHHIRMLGCPFGGPIGGARGLGGAQEPGAGSYIICVSNCMR